MLLPTSARPVCVSRMLGSRLLGNINRLLSSKMLGSTMCCWGSERPGSRLLGNINHRSIGHTS